MLEAIPNLGSPPSGIIVANAFSSIRDFGGRAGGLYGLLAKFSPDWWNNVRAVRRIAVPIIIVHSESDAVNPLADAQKIFAAANEPKSIVVLREFSHNALYRQPSETWWQAVLKFTSQPGSLSH